MYDVCKTKLGVCWGLFDKVSPAFELRNPGVLLRLRVWSYPGSICTPAVTGSVAGLLYPFPVTVSPSSSSLIVYWLDRPVNKISPAFELRNPGVPAVVRSSQLSRMEFRQTSLRLYQIKQVAPPYH
jgi:hypothetical protein